METKKRPTFGNGKICYMEIPAVDIQQSATFYQAVFGWHVRHDDEGNAAFDDAVTEVSGMWVTNRHPATANTGIMVSIMVSNLRETLNLITSNGGGIVEQDASGQLALFTDPAGNTMSLYESNH
jgi:predicted enzyme related to lactoylglutathione lyase